MKILAFAASSSKQSINKQLVTYATSLLKDASVEIIDLNDYELPLYSVDAEAELGQPEVAKRFIEKIAACDAVVISLAEHNGTYTAAYKNLFDWASRVEPKVFQGKQMVYLSTTPGPGGAKSVLSSAVDSAHFFNGEVKASLSIPSYFENFDTEAGTLTNEELNEQLQAAMHSLK